MKRRLKLNAETVRLLTNLEHVNGGEKTIDTGGSQCWCPSAPLTLCPACPITVTDGCP